MKKIILLPTFFIFTYKKERIIHLSSGIIKIFIQKRKCKKSFFYELHLDIMIFLIYSDSLCVTEQLLFSYKTSNGQFVCFFNMQGIHKVSLQIQAFIAHTDEQIYIWKVVQHKECILKLFSLASINKLLFVFHWLHESRQGDDSRRLPQTLSFVHSLLYLMLSPSPWITYADVHQFVDDTRNLKRVAQYWIKQGVGEKKYQR